MNATSTALLAGLAPYTGPWTFEEAAHLLRRTTFGPSLERIKWSVAQGLEATIDKLFEDLPLPSPPVNAYFPSDPDVAIGESWVNAPYTDVGAQTGYRFRSLTSWTMGQIWEEGIHIREKLTLFWHNHFPVNSIEDPKFLYRYIHTMRSHAWGNFRDLTKAVTVDPAMLRFLNGNQNKKEAPNENYARELLELFTVGKGPLAGPGDYTNYNEQDVQQIARILSGWRDYGLNGDSIGGDFGAYFTPDRHDDGVKNLSFHFNNEVVNDMGDQEYAYLIDIIFQQDEVARFICRKLYQWFVFHEITPAIETDVIQPMAQMVIDSDYEIKPALMALLGSEHFFDTQFRGLIIKNPIDHLMSIARTLEVDISTPLDQRYDSWYRFWGVSRVMDMEYFEIPEVAGWQAYYRAPLFYRNWLSASTLPQRMDYSEELFDNGLSPFQGNGDPIRVDALKFLASLDTPEDPNAIVDQCVGILFSKPLSAQRKEALKGILLPGLPDFEWTVEYLDYAANPTDPQYYNPVDAKLRALLKAMITMPDFFLS